ncbi:hypothetical protein U9J35_21820 [Rossellomorea aquimaris]|nr:hypothetical protein [Rossellomorea aquimaris]WRP06458.1 hypothetical protein U9J35_21820 [Rossellomorea aquimaris]
MGLCGDFLEEDLLVVLKRVRHLMGSEMLRGVSALASSGCQTRYV